MKKSRTERCRCNNAGRTIPSFETPRPVTEKETSTTASASAPSTTPKSLEIVEWRDANFFINDDAFEGEYINSTVGWTEQEDDKWLKIVSERTPDGDRAVTRVPLVNIVRRKPLVIVNFHSTWTTLPGPTE